MFSVQNISGHWNFNNHTYPCCLVWCMNPNCQYKADITEPVISDRYISWAQPEEPVMYLLLWVSSVFETGCCFQARWERRPRSTLMMFLLRTVVCCRSSCLWPAADSLSPSWLLTCMMNVSLLFAQTHPSGICLQARLDVGGSSALMLSAQRYPTLLK